MKSKPSDPTPATITTEQLAKLANLTPRRINQLATESKIPTPNAGKFPMLQAITALFSYYQRDGEEIQKEKLKMLTAQRHMTELKLQKQRGEVVPSIAVAAVMRRVLPQVPAILNQRLVQEASTPEEKIRARKAIDEALTAIRELGSEFAELSEHQTNPNPNPTNEK